MIGGRLPWLLAILLSAVALATIFFLIRNRGSDAGEESSAASYVGRDVCLPCHEEQSRLWHGSHHDLAMQQVTEAAVRGDFHDATYTHFDVTSRFYRRDGKYFVLTDGPDGELREFEIAYVFGVYPLQQYLIEFPGGRYQALSICWDCRSESEGGQRWFHLYPEERIPYGDELHWTGPNQNWNYMCAGCHSTDLRRNYDPSTDTYATTWAEIDVSCEACHGPASRHVEWAERNPGAAAAGWQESGLTLDLGERRRANWVFDDTSRIARREPPAERSELVEICAPCHSRRSQISRHGGPLLMSAHRPELLTEGLYYPDGQILDEVYVYGSFIQSKMYHSGVTCTDCHDPHSMKVYAEGNELCARCHLSSEYDTEEHHFHPPGSAGAQCVECHMPARDYMVVDPRRDHSLRVPRPDLTSRIGAPNACNGCHDDRSAEWAGQQLDAWYGSGWRHTPHYGEAIYAGRKRQAGAQAGLLRLARDRGSPGIARATALSLLAEYDGRRSVAAIGEGLISTDPLIRLGAVYALPALAPELAFRMGEPLLEDPVLAVRIEAALMLARTPDGLMTGEQRASLRRALDEYQNAQLVNAERAESHLNLGLLHAYRGEMEPAEASYRTALRIDSTLIPAYVNLADLYRMQGRDADGRVLLERALAAEPGNAEVHHALGLLLVRQKKLAEAIEELRRAMELNPERVRYAYVYAVALHAGGQTRQAVAVLQEALERAPDDVDLLTGLLTIHGDEGQIEQAVGYARRLQRVDPGNPVASQYLNRSGGG